MTAKHLTAMIVGAMLAIQPAPAFAKRQRSAVARHAFVKSNPCPATGRARLPCPGYVIDHVVPLKRGGPDAPSNMQWQTKSEAKAKDRWE